MSLFVYGPQVVFLANPRKVVTLYMYDVNYLDKTVALWYSEVGLNIPKLFPILETGYVFSIDDFHPSPEQINWATYSGEITCYKSIDGKNQWLPPIIQNQRDEIRLLDQHIDIRDTKIHTLLQSLEKRSQLLRADSYGLMEESKRLGEIKKLAEIPEIRFVRGAKAPSGALPQLMEFEGGRGGAQYG